MRSSHESAGQASAGAADGADDKVVGINGSVVSFIKTGEIIIGTGN